MTDLLGRNIGHITETKPGIFEILPAGKAVESFRAIRSKPYASLDIALAAIEEHIEGVCHCVQSAHND